MTAARQPKRRRVTVYLAVPDPNNAAQMTYWRRTGNGTLTEWPSKAKYAPVLHKRDVPSGLDTAARFDWARRWYAENAEPWWAAIRAAIETDEAECARRFAEFCARCCVCGRKLTNETSKVYGIGPECRANVPTSWLADGAKKIGQAHAEHLSGGAGDPWAPCAARP
jgi:hypothetical protein